MFFIYNKWGNDYCFKIFSSWSRWGWETSKGPSNFSQSLHTYARAHSQDKGTFRTLSDVDHSKIIINYCSGKGGQDFIAKIHDVSSATVNRHIRKHNQELMESGECSYCEGTNICPDCKGTIVCHYCGGTGREMRLDESTIPRHLRKYVISEGKWSCGIDIFMIFYVGLLNFYQMA